MMGQSEAQSKSTEKPPSKNSDANKISHQNQKFKRSTGQRRDNRHYKNNSAQSYAGRGQTKHKADKC